MKWTKTCKKSLGIVFGVVPEHQGKGIESALIVSYSKKLAWKKGFQYNDLENELDW